MDNKYKNKNLNAMFIYQSRADEIYYKLRLVMSGRNYPL